MSSVKEYRVEELLEMAQAGDEAAKSQMVEQNLGLVWSLIHRFKQSRIPQDELFQVGCLGLVKAINNFDASFKVKFSTYAVPIILGEIKRYFRDEGSIHVSRSVKENYLKLSKLRDEMIQTLHREPTYYELAEKSNLDVEDVLQAFEANQFVASMDEPIYDKEGNSTTLEDRMKEPKTIDVVSLLALKDEIKLLEQRDQTFLFYRYYKEMNQDSIAKKFGISQVQVSRMEKRILEYLLHKLEGK